MNELSSVCLTDLRGVLTDIWKTPLWCYIFAENWLNKLRYEIKQAKWHCCRWGKRTFSERHHEFVSDGTGGAKLYGIITPLNQLLTGGSNWYFSYGNLSTFGQPYWDKAANDLYTKEGEVLSYMYLNANIIYFKSGSYPGKYTMTSSLQGDNNIGFKLSGYDSNGQFYYTNGYFQYFLYPFCGASGRSFTLSCDNIQNPTVIILTDVTDSSNVITLTKKSSAPYWKYI